MAILKLLNTLSTHYKIWIPVNSNTSCILTRKILHYSISSHLQKSFSPFCSEVQNVFFLVSTVSRVYCWGKKGNKSPTLKKEISTLNFSLLESLEECAYIFPMYIYCTQKIDKSLTIQNKKQRILKHLETKNICKCSSYDRVIKISDLNLIRYLPSLILHNYLFFSSLYHTS